MEILFEGIEAVRFPCTFALLVPALGFVIAAGRRAPVVATAFVLGAAGLSWARAARFWSISADGVAAVAAAVVLIGAIAVVSGLGPQRTGQVVGAAIAGGAVIGWIWRPCVGSNLATIFNDAPLAPVRTLASMVVYIGAACLIAIVVAALPVAFPLLTPWRDHRTITMVGASVVVVIAALIAIGFYDDLVAELLRRSSF
jgi:hypothetical protein